MTEKNKMKSKKPKKILYIGLDEEWKSIYINSEITKYEVSNLGEIRNTKKNGKLLTQILDKYGYPQVCLCHSGKRYSKSVHRLVAEAFIENTFNKPQVNHINGKKYDNWIHNLEWVSNKENVNHSYKNGFHENTAKGEKYGQNKYKEKDINKVCKLLEKNKYTMSEISNRTGVKKSTILDILSKKYWNHISDNYNISNYSVKSYKGIDNDLKEKIIKLAKTGKYTTKTLRKELGLKYDSRINAIISYYIKKY